MPGLAESFDILFESIKVHYYTKGKLLFQSSPTNKTYANLIPEIDRKFSLNSLDGIEQESIDVPSDLKYFVGCDESGTGETFGSIFLGCVVVDAGNLKNIQRIFDNPNIKNFEEYEILEKYDKIKKYCEILKINARHQKLMREIKTRFLIKNTKN